MRQLECYCKLRHFIAGRVAIRSVCFIAFDRYFCPVSVQLLSKKQSMTTAGGVFYTSRWKHELHININVFDSCSFSTLNPLGFVMGKKKTFFIDETFTHVFLINAVHLHILHTHGHVVKIRTCKKSFFFWKTDLHFKPLCILVSLFLFCSEPQE